MSRKISIPGFRFAGLWCGIKPRAIKDLALIYCDEPSVVAGTFTQHPMAAAPVHLTKQRVKSGSCQAVIINSGNANACTGKNGECDTRAMTDHVAQVLGIKKSDVLICSTGVIGVPLPMPKVIKGIKQASETLSAQAFSQAAEAILTTDQGVKIAQIQGKIGQQSYQIAAFAKGAGMIEPDMISAHQKPHATMLAFVMTDLALQPRWADQVLRDAVDATFNRISVDGDTSTNDTCLLLASGAAGNKPLRSGQTGAKQFATQLREILSQLAYQMVADGEGATKVVRLIIKRAPSAARARKIAYVVANSQLVRTSFFGADPNWGRIIAAVGSADRSCNASSIDISYESVKVCRRGQDAGAAAEKKAKKLMQRPQFTVTVDCRAGSGSFELLSSDLTLDYVKLNADYRT